MKSKFSQYKYRAEKKGLKFQILEKDFNHVQAGNCLYCGDELANGVDRVDNFEGYTKDNVTACCWVCNRAKNNMTDYEFITWLKRLLHHNKYIIDDSVSLEGKYRRNLEIRQASNVLDIKEYEEDALFRFKTATTAILSIPETLINVILKKSKTDTFFKQSIVRWMFGVDNYFKPEQTAPYFEKFNKPEYILSFDNNLNPKIIRDLLQTLPLSKKEQKLLKKVTVTLLEHKSDNTNIQGYNLQLPRFMS